MTAEEDNNNKYMANVGAPLEHFPELDDLDLNADTLEFEPISRRRVKPKRFASKLIIGVLVAVFLGYFAWANWSYLLLGSDLDELPVIRAPNIALKVRPDKPGGTPIPNRDKLVYDRLEKEPPVDKIESLLPRPEIPLLPPKPDKIINPNLSPESEKKITKPTTLGSQPSIAEVNKVREPGPIKQLKQVVVIEPTKKSASAKKMIGKIKNNVKPISSLKLNQNASNTPNFRNNFQIQLAAVNSSSGAKREWLRLQNKYKKLLGPLKLNIVKVVKSKNKIFFRLRAGPLENILRARELCGDLSRLKVGCLVIRPGK